MARPWRELLGEIHAWRGLQEWGIEELADGLGWRAHVCYWEEMGDWRTVEHVGGTAEEAQAWVVTWLWEHQQPLTARSTAP